MIHKARAVGEFTVFLLFFLFGCKHGDCGAVLAFFFWCVFIAFVFFGGEVPKDNNDGILRFCFYVFFLVLFFLLGGN